MSPECPKGIRPEEGPQGNGTVLEKERQWKHFRKAVAFRTRPEPTKRDEYRRAADLNDR